MGGLHACRHGRKERRLTVLGRPVEDICALLHVGVHVRVSYDDDTILYLA